MIEGLKLLVRSVELKTHCELRSEYHRKRADEKEAQLPKLRESLEVLRGSGLPATSYSNMNKGSQAYHLDPDDPIKDLEKDIQDHRNKSLVFEFFAGHLFDDDYTLKEDDLQRLELLKR